MKSIWRGSISFGLINIPVKVCGAVEANQVSFNQVHEFCKHRISYKKYCSHCQKDVSSQEITKGYQTPGGMLIVSEDDLASIPLKSLKTIELDGFIRERDVDSLFYQKPYYLLPDKSNKAYWLLYQSLKKSGRAGIARFATHSREHLALVRPARNVLTLCTLYYPEEIRHVNETPEKPDPKQLDLALNLIKQQTIEFDPGIYSNRYREALENMLAKKQPEPAPAESPKILDLMEALRLSLEKSMGKTKSA